MQANITLSQSLFLILFSLIMATVTVDAQDFYWVGGSGDWDDITHWSKESASIGIVPTGAIPDDNTIVIIDEFSGLDIGNTLTVPPGTFEVHSINVTSQKGFTLLFDGSSGNSTTMNVYGDLTLTTTMFLSYTSASRFHNNWIFDGSGNHAIYTGGKDLNAIEFLHVNGIYTQIDDILSSEHIRMHAGTWNTQGFDVTSEILLFLDNFGSSNPRVKTFSTSGSDIYADEWNSTFTYGSLTLNGSHTIYAKQFLGSRILSGTGLDEIHLLELPDAQPAGTSVIEYNNFDCYACVVDKIIVEDTGNTRLACPFTVNQEFTVLNTGSTIQFNGGNSRPNNIIINGSITTPVVSGCDSKTIFENAYNQYTSLERVSGTLDISDAILDNIQATGGATFNLIDGVLLGSSSGWNVTNNQAPLDYEWIGVTGVNANWNEPANWSLANGSYNGCVPTLTDNVTVSSNAKGGIRILAGYTAECNNFKWTNQNGFDLELAGTTFFSSNLSIGGWLQLDPSMSIVATSSHEMIFSSGGQNFIETKGVALPEVTFKGSNAIWDLVDDFSCDRIVFESGTLNTMSNDIQTSSWITVGQANKTYNFGSSLITVTGTLNLNSYISGAPTTVNPGTSLIECGKLTFFDPNAVLHDLRLTNTTSTEVMNRALTLNRLFLSGSGEVTTSYPLTVEELVFENSGGTLKLHNSPFFGGVAHLTVNGGIESLASSGNPAVLKTKTTGVSAILDKTIGNLCVVGPVTFQDIDSQLSGVVHAPEGIDAGNNTGINFTPISTTSTLYWIAGSEKFESIQNYSSVSGGCPYPLSNPSNPTLIFDDNGLFSSTEVIIANGPITSSQIHFLNSSSTIELSISGLIETDELIVNGGDVRIQGDDLIVTIETVLDSGGVLITNLQNYNTKKLLGESGIFIARSGSTVLIND